MLMSSFVAKAEYGSACACRLNEAYYDKLVHTLGYQLCLINAGK